MNNQFIEKAEVSDTSGNQFFNLLPGTDSLDNLVVFTDETLRKLVTVARTYDTAYFPVRGKYVKIKLNRFSPICIDDYKYLIEAVTKVYMYAVSKECTWVVENAYKNLYKTKLSFISGEE